MTTQLDRAAHDPNHTIGTKRRIGGGAALVEAATFLVGIAMFVTLLGDYTEEDATPSESVAFLVDNQTALFIWYFITLIVFGIALVPLTLRPVRRSA
jgi:hypothetical protein